MLVGSAALGTSAAEAAGDPRDWPSRPNFLIMLTDQERHAQHWPPGLLEKLMPSWSRLARHGLYFNRAYCSASECSPSRACIVTGEYENINGVPALPADGMPTLPGLPTIASVLGAAGYDVYWKGKWHLSFPEGFKGGPPSGEVWSAEDIAGLDEKYGMRQWNPPDAGNSAGAYTPAASKDEVARKADLATAGGGTANNDARILEGPEPGVEETAGFGASAMDLLQRLGATPKDRRRPFAVFVSFVNPHDITFFPNGWQDLAYEPGAWEDLGVELPPNADDDLATKPSIQKAYRDALDKVTPLDDGINSPANYINFYAHLHRTVEPHIEKTLDALDAFGLAEDTIVIRTADHGELGMSHGLREKAYTAYEEMIHVPLVISNPVLFPEPATTEALYTHVDMMATLADLAGAEPVGVGASMVPVMLDPEQTVQDDVLFAFDDSFLLDDLPGSHIRALRDTRWTYAVYYKPGGTTFEYELYDNDADPGQLNNLLHEPAPDIKDTWARLHGRLIDKMARAKAKPKGTDFPNEPA
jgi:arylsulfatase A-like enzyme